MLQEIVEQVRQSAITGERPVVVLDLDSTLIHTGARHLAIAQDFAAAEPALAPFLEGLGPDDFGWSVDEPLRRRGAPEPLLDALLAWWGPRFFDGAWLVHDRPTPGAVGFCQRLIDAGGWLVYLSGRPAPTMGAGTVESLMRCGFPALRARASLHLKPSVHLDDARFKRAAIEEIAILGRVVATAENEPAHANHFAARFPNARHLLVGDVRHPDAPSPSPQVSWVADLR